MTKKELEKRIQALEKLVYALVARPVVIQSQQVNPQFQQMFPQQIQPPTLPGHGQFWCGTT